MSGPRCLLWFLRHSIFYHSIPLAAGATQYQLCDCHVLSTTSGQDGNALPTTLPPGTITWYQWPHRAPCVVILVSRYLPRISSIHPRFRVQVAVQLHTHSTSLAVWLQTPRSTARQFRADQVAKDSQTTGPMYKSSVSNWPRPLGFTE